MDMDDPPRPDASEAAAEEGSPCNGPYHPPSLLETGPADAPPPTPPSGFEAHVRAYMTDRLHNHDSCAVSDAMSEPPPSLQAVPAVALAEVARSTAGSPVNTWRVRFRSAERLSWQRGAVAAEGEDNKRKAAFKSIPSSNQGVDGHRAKLFCG